MKKDKVLDQKQNMSIPAILYMPLLVVFGLDLIIDLTGIFKTIPTRENAFIFGLLVMWIALMISYFMIRGTMEDKK